MARRTFLVVGSGGREHALAWRLSRDRDQPLVYVAPGNAGIAADTSISGGVVPIDAMDFEGLARFAREHDVTLTVVGPEGPLCAGIVDDFEARGLPIFGPSMAAAELEGSKAFAKQIMDEAGVPTADFAVFDELDEALAYVQAASHPIVLKADGLAAGKGVVIANTLAESAETLRQFMAEGTFGEASRRVVIEACLTGPEMSFMAIVDGPRILTMATSQDHKRVGEGDTGPNTGGMGAFTPSPHASPELEQAIIATVLRPVITTLAGRGITYRGFLYAGMMLTEQGPKVLEFNCRMGDPETQALLFAMDDDVDFGAVLSSAIEGRLEDGKLPTPYQAFCIVLASGGYPGPIDTGHPITGLDEASSVPSSHVFHAGTRQDDSGRFINASGRVLGVTARGHDAAEARHRAYEAVSKICWEGMHYRRDIGGPDGH
jgi:phosphoribosylamine---glycine ligase